MTAQNGFSKQADELRKQGKFNEACEMYARTFQEEPAKCDKWTAWGYAYCLRKSGAKKESLLLCREALQTWPDFQILRNLYAWNLFDDFSDDKSSDAKQPANDRELIAKAELVLDNSSPEDEKSPYVPTVFRVLKSLKSKVPYNANLILEWLDKLDYNKLDETCRSFDNGRGRSFNIASRKEEYLSIKTKALLRAGCFSECRDLSEKALNDLKSFNYDNDVWFKSRIAYCHHQEGNLETSLQLYQEILQKKPEWFIHKEVAAVFLDMNQPEKALKHCVSGCLGFGDATKKVGLFLLLAEILEKVGNSELAAQHVKLVYAIRKVNGWKVDAHLMSLQQKYGILETEDLAVNGLLKTLRREWEGLRFSENSKKYGRVKSILPTGNAGFIQQDNGGTFFFRVNDFKGSRSLLEAGLEVSFYLEDGFDRKKNKPTKVAVNICSERVYEQKESNVECAV
jgi:tetratricopeptide (TPR) repeat protein